MTESRGFHGEGTPSAKTEARGALDEQNQGLCAGTMSKQQAGGR